MVIVKAVVSDSPQLQQVQRLWRENSKTLGFFPEGAFAERARKRQILAAVDQDSTVLGYVLFYTDKNQRIRITHLCVDKGNRGKGIARQLVDELRSQKKSYRGIGLFCRKDFRAWEFWPRLGFLALSEKVGQSKDGHELTYFWLPNTDCTLFPLGHDIDDDRLTVAIDSNVLYDLIDPERNGAEETLGITADWLQPLVQFCVTPELFHEVQRNPDPEERMVRTAKAREYALLEYETDDFQAAYDLVRNVLGQSFFPRDESDQRHLAQAIASKAAAFVTRDQRLLDHADQLYDCNGLSVIRPSQLVAQHEELRNEADYQRDRLAGTELQIRRMSSDAKYLADAFVSLVTSEKKWQLENSLNAAFAHPDDYECHCISASDDRPLAMYVLKVGETKHARIPFFRVSGTILQTRLAGTLTRTLLAKIVRDTAARGKQVLQITDPMLNTVVMDALQDMGFFLGNGSWWKLSLSGMLLPSEVASHIRQSLDDAAVDEPAVLDVLSVIEDESFPSNPEAVLKIEHLLWPGKIIGTSVRNYVIPIRPQWATDLFDAGMARARLWEADTELALNVESVYYRAVRPKVLDEPGRVLWYVSGDTVPEAKKIRACSQIAEIVTGQPKEIFRRFRRFGVFEWRNVLEVAGSQEGEVMAVSFIDTELFPEPVNWHTIQSILRRFGKNSTFPSPVKISEEIFVDLYRAGIGQSE